MYWIDGFYYIGDTKYSIYKYFEINCKSCDIVKKTFAASNEEAFLEFYIQAKKAWFKT